MATSLKTLREAGLVPRQVYAVQPDDTVLSAIAMLDAKDVGALAVTDGERLVGIVSERDCARKLELQGRSAAGTLVRQIMSASVVYVTPEHRIDQCAAIMRKEHLRHLPVLDGTQLVAFLSMRDVLQELVVEEEHLIHDFETERLAMTTDTGSY